MNATALTTPAPQPLTAACAHCHRTTHAPVPIRWTEQGLHYACPHCAPHHPHGPTPDE
ncbi:hypothetical protein ACWEFL_29400 [Streptomyces sp. NPDC004838]